MIKTAPRGSYQTEAVERAMAHDGFLLSCEQRTGKCWMALNVVDQRKPKNLWIVCPIQAFDTWKKEIAKHLKVDWDCNFMMINYEELVARRKYYYKQGNKIGRENLMIIIDEAHRIKNRGKAISRTTRILGRRARYKLALTGTPISQGKHDAWALYNFIAPEIFGPFDDKVHKKTGEIIKIGFASRFLIMGGFMNKKIIGYRNPKKYKRLLHSQSFRVTLRESREKSLRIRFSKVYFDLEPQVRRIYEDLERDLRVEVNKKKVSVPVVVALTMKLQQICGGFVIDEERIPHRIGRSAWKKLKRLVLGLHAAGEKFVIVCRFLYEIEVIQESLSNLNISTKRVIGGEPFDGEFDTDGIVIQVQNGVAVDMSEAHHCIFYSTDFSYVNFEQMRFRILNWEKPVASFHFLIARDTIVEQIYEAVRRKKKIADLVLDKYRKRRNVRKS